MRKLLLLFTVLLQLTAFAQEPYAAYDNGTLTFYYDENKDIRNGMGIGPYNAYSKAPWKDLDFSTVIFDQSFAQYEGLTSTAYWFWDCKKLEQIDGLEYLKTDNVTNMAYMFSGCSGLKNVDLRNFNTNNVTDMAQMFYSCSSLTELDASKFNTANVTNMQLMFGDCSSLTTLNVSGFNTSKVTTMGQMFQNCSSLENLDLTGFDTKNVLFMEWMFLGCSSLKTLNVSQFNTENVTNMARMFLGCSALTELSVSNFNTSNVTDMSSLFSSCSSLSTLSVTNFDTSKVTSMNCMFSDCSSLTELDLSHFNTSNVTNMGEMFSGCSSLKSLNINDFKTNNVNDIWWMFSGCSSLEELDLSHFVTDKVTSLEGLFNNCSSLKSLNLSSFNTSNVTTMHMMFSNCSSLKVLNIGGFNTAEVTSMLAMFTGCESLTTIYVGNGWNTEKVADAVGYNADIFYGCDRLIGGNGTAHSTESVGHSSDGYMFTLARIDRPGSPGLLTDVADATNGNQSNSHIYAIWCEDNKTLYFTATDEEYITGGSFDGQSIAAKWEYTDITVSPVSVDPDWISTISNSVERVVFDGSFKEIKCKSMYRWFYGCEKLETFEGLENLNTSEVVTMQDMFYNCKSLRRLDLSSFNTSKVTNMWGMFHYCVQLGCIVVGDEWDISAVTSSNYMFSDCDNLVGGDGTVYSNLTNDATYAKVNGGLLTLKGSTIIADSYAVWCEGNKTLFFINTTDILEKGGTYNGESITDIWGWKEIISISNYTNKNWRGYYNDIEKVVFDPAYKKIPIKSSFYWFANCGNLVSIEGLEYLNTSNIKIMEAMFAGCSKLEYIDVSHFDTKKVVNMGSMFSGCGKLLSLDLSGFDTGLVEDMHSMFSGCYGLSILDISGFDTKNVTDFDYMFSNNSFLELKLGENFDTSSASSYENIFNNNDLMKITFTGNVPANLKKDIFAGLGSESTPLYLNVPNEYKSNYQSKIDADGKFYGGYVTFSPYKYPYAVYDDENKALTFTYSEKLTGENVYLVDKYWNPSEMALEHAAEIKKVIFDESFIEYKPTSTSSWFNYDGTETALEEFIGIENLNTSEVESMVEMFDGCVSLTYLDLSHFDTSKVKSMEEMFYSCCNLKEILFNSNLDTRAFDGEYSSDLFYNCLNLSTISFNGDIPTNLDKDIFVGIGSVGYPAYLKVPEEYRTNYENALGENGLFHGGYFTLDESNANTSTTIPAKAGTYWMTFYTEDGNYRLPEDVEVYYVNDAHPKYGVALTKRWKNIIPKSGPVLLHSTSEGGFGENISVIKCSDDFDLGYISKFFKGVTEPTDISGRGDVYVLIGSQFVRADLSSSNTTLAANRCYISFGNSNGARILDLVIGDNATTIRTNVEVDAKGGCKWYNLQGQRINQPTEKGLYINNGKKVIVK